MIIGFVAYLLKIGGNGSRRRTISFSSYSIGIFPFSLLVLSFPVYFPVFFFFLPFFHFSFIFLSFFLLSFYLSLFRRQIFNHLAVEAEHAGARDVTHQAVVDVDNRQIVSVLDLKLLHHLLHTVVYADLGRHRRHDLHDTKLGVELRAEHDVSDLRNVDLAKNAACTIEDRDEAGVAFADDVYQFAQRHVGCNGNVVVLNDAVQAHKRQRCLVGVMGDELALTGKTHGVDAVGLKNAYCHHGTGADDH